MSREDMGPTVAVEPLHRVGERPTPRKGPVRILCDEIGFEFSPALERQDVLVAFVAQLVGQIEHQRWMNATIAERFKGKPPSPGSATVLGLAQTMLEQTDREALILAAAAVHDAAHELNPDEAYPTDHVIDMLSSCASAIRFGLESFGLASRHAASAASHIWAQVYGVSLFDNHTPDWEKQWARSQLLAALVSLLPPRLSDGPLSGHDAAPQPQRSDP